MPTLLEARLCGSDWVDRSTQRAGCVFNNKVYSFRLKWLRQLDKANCLNEQQPAMFANPLTFEHVHQVNLIAIGKAVF
eukprot:609896-Amphidinium_carterae.1